MSFLDTAKKLVDTLADAMMGPVVPAVVEIGKDVVELLKQSKAIVAIDDVEQLNMIIDELEPKVMAHADSTEDKLRG